MTTKKTQQIVKGICGSDGIAIAPAYFLDIPTIDITQAKINDPQDEIKKYLQATKTSCEQIRQIAQIASETIGEEKAEIFAAHEEILNDHEISQSIQKLIHDSKLNSLAAVKQVFENYITIFKNSTNSYLKERATDMNDIMTRLLTNLSGTTLPDLFAIKEPCIIVCNDLTPSQVTILNTKFVRGFVTKIGGKTSHSAIIARTKGIPCILSLGDNIKQIKKGDVLALDSTKSQVVINPNDPKEWENKIAKYIETKKEYDKYSHQQAITKDGKKVHVEINIGNADDAAIASECGADGVGLFRSEFLYMHSDQWPTQETQTKNYQKALKYLNDKTVVIRTLDIGGDKKLPYYTFEHEDNPFLGFRAIRFCLEKKEIFITQLRALLQASPMGKLAIMFPMIASIQELLEAKKILEEQKTTLIKEGIEVAKDIQIGMMIEIPAAAVCADLFAKHVDFFSIGTNDLIQYTMACDRMSKKVSYLYQPNHPGVLRLIKTTIDAAHKYNKWTGMCGEMASDALSLPILLGMGLDAFSVSSSCVAKTKYMINNLNFSECKKLVEKCFELETCQEINTAVQNFLDQRKIKY